MCSGSGKDNERERRKVLATLTRWKMEEDFFYVTGGMILYAEILDIFESGERERRRRGVVNLNR